jgi:hypothetical protein
MSEMENPMYCPHCGRIMTLIDGVFTCVYGSMPLSQRMHATLAERYPLVNPRKPGIQIGKHLTRWFCPGCGVPLERGMTCPDCGKSLHDLLFPLVELHPHFGADDA